MTVACSTNNRSLCEKEIFVDFNDDSQPVINSVDDLFNYSNYIDTVIYVHLETTDECLLGDIDDMHYVNDRLFLRCGRSVYVFDKDGKFISKVARYGRGHGEYITVCDFDVNPTNNEINIYDVGNRRVSVYSLEGVFLRNVHIDGIGRNFCVLPNGNYLFYTPDYMGDHYRGAWQTDTEGNFINQPLVLSGSARHTVLREHELIHINDKEVGVLGPMGFDNIYHICADTSEIAYHIATNITIDPKVLEVEYSETFWEQEIYMIGGYSETANLVSFYMTDMKKSVDVKLDKKTGRIYTNFGNTHFLNGDKIPFINGVFCFDYGVGLGYITAANLLMFPEEARMQFAPEITLDSNPIISLCFYQK